MQITEQYNKQLDLVRQNPSLLENYRFDKDAGVSNHFERLRLNIAMYNDFRESDYEIAKFLFEEEVKWRDVPWGENLGGEVDNLYFSAFLLTLFKKPEVIWSFIYCKSIDFDSGIGFDSEYLLAPAGIEGTYAYLGITEHDQKPAVLDYLGESVAKCIYSQDDIDFWADAKVEYFKGYLYPIEDELNFLSSTNEKDLFLQKFPEWIAKERQWTNDELSDFCIYAEYSEDKQLYIKALELAIEKNGNDGRESFYREKLMRSYVDAGQYEKAVQALQSAINDSSSDYTTRNCVEQLCRIILLNKDNITTTSANAFEIIKQQKRNYEQFSPYVDRMVEEVYSIMKDSNVPPTITSDHTAQQRTGLWNSIKQLFGFKNKSE